MWIKNVNLFTKENRFLPGAVRVEGERIREICFADENGRKQIVEKKEWDGEETLDGEGHYLLPGMIDMHLHGCVGADFCDGTMEALQKIAEYEASIGVTAIAPAVMTLPGDELLQILHTAALFRHQQLAEPDYGQAQLVGIHMEGPFISPRKCGAQDASYILPGNRADFIRFQNAAEGLIKIVGIAPEEMKTEQISEFFSAIGDGVTVALAHTNADYDTAVEAFANGASHVVHLFNAMPPFHHRAPGVVGAVVDCREVTAELICDGVHVHPSMMRSAFALLGEDRIILISDSMRATGLKDGEYLLGGQKVSVKGNCAKLQKDGSLAGSVTTLPDCVRYAVTKAGIPLETAIASATIRPALRLGIAADYGSIEIGKYADLVIWDDTFRLRTVIRHGKQII